MRSILPYLLLIVMSCSGQPGIEQEAKIDTTKLFNPHPETVEIGAAAVNMFKRNIIFQLPEHYIITFNDKEHELTTLRNVEEFISSNKDEIQKHKFYLITDSSTRFKRIVSIIDILKENQIFDYIVINVGEFFKPQEPVTIVEPRVVETRITENDSAYFSITIRDNTINVRLFGNETRLNSLNDLDAFVLRHKPEIKNIRIVMPRKYSEKRFKEILGVLKKHEFVRFQLVTE